MENIDFDETFTPTMRFESLRLLFALAILLGLRCYQLDIDNAYLNSILREVIYIVFPPRFPIPPGIRGDGLRLLKSLYDLKQSARI